MSHAGEVEPLDVALLVVAADHLAVGHLLAEAVGGLVGVDGEVHRRGVPLLLGFTFLLLGRLGFLFPRRGQGQFVRGVVHQRAVGGQLGGVAALAVARASRAAVGGALGGRGLLDAGSALGVDPLGFAGLLEAERMRVHLAGAVFHQLRHLSHYVDFLVAQLLAEDQRPLQLDLQPLPLSGVLFAFVFLKHFVHLVQHLCKEKTSM
uniref:Uncharacterized protein n=1 Tax=Cyprinodon variegatus TaxID=28743 RepID=A0A3Q2FK48_CYPVA